MSKRGVAIAVFIVSLAMTGLAVLWTFMLLLLPETIRRDRAIDATFNEAAAFVEKAVRDTGSMPTPGEWDAFRATSNLNGVHGVRDVLLIPFHEIRNHSELVDSFETNAQQGSFALSLWRGEWTEYYASWERRSTVPSERQQWFSFSILAIAFSGLGYFGLRWSNRLRKELNDRNVT